MVTPAGQRGGGRVLARRYHLQRVLGRGAMGAVWEAEDTFLRRTVAVKEVVIPGSLSPDERAVSVERTMREARAIARLGHPNVVTLFDVLDEDARPWVVMELVPSRSLAEVIKEDGPLHPLRVATVGLAILGALEAAHAAGITHRDVKPGNILLGHDGRVKLTDFGIARAAGDDTITGTGLLVGSPSYIAPEIIKGQEAGAPADLWGLGATLYASVEGRAPFSGGDAMETLSKVVQDPPTPYVRAGALIPALDAMLDKDPLKRAKPVDARRALLDVLRGGNDAEVAPARSAPAAAPAPVAPPEPPAVPAASGPLLSDLLVPIWRQDQDSDAAPDAAPPRRSASTRTPAAPATGATPTGSAGGASASGASDDPGTRVLSTAASGATAAEVASAAGSGPEAADEPVAGDEAALPTGSVAGSPVAEHSREVLAEDDDLVDPDVVDPDLVEAELDSGTRTDLGLPPQPTAATPAEAAAAASAPAAAAASAPAASAAPAPAAAPAAAAAAAAAVAGAAAAAAFGPSADAVDRDEPADAPADLAAGAPDQVDGEPADPDDDDTEPVPVADEEPVDVGPVETGSEATVTIPTGDPPGRPVTFGPADRFGPTVALSPYDRGSAGATRVGAPSRAGDPGEVGEAAHAGERGRADADAGRDGETVWLGDTARTADAPAARTGEAARPGDARPGDGRPGDARPGDARPGDARPGDAAREWAGDRAATAARTSYGAYGGADSEKPTQMIAPLPFGGAQGTLSEQQPARAFRAQPPAAVLGFPQERPRDDRRKRTIGALLIVIALVAVVGLGGALLIRSVRGNDDGGGTTTPTGTSSTLGPAKIPSGFTAYEGTGFSVAVPAGWPTEGKGNGVVDAKEPTSTRFIRLITVDSQATAFAQLSAAEKQFDASPDYGDYQRVSLQRVDYRGLDAADWEFTFTLKGTPRHVLYRGIVTGGRTYGLYLSTPETEWARTKNVFQVAADTFRTS